MTVTTRTSLAPFFHVVLRNQYGSSDFAGIIAVDDLGGFQPVDSILK